MTFQTDRRPGLEDAKTDTSVVGLYIHVPFCRFKCYYCDFNTYAGIESLIAPYIAALSTEILRWGASLAAIGGERPRLSSVYFGGGTPSLLSPPQVGQVLAAVRKAFDLTDDAEITMEVNPESVDTNAMRERRFVGINRVSMGAQTFDDDQLRLLGRLHDASRIESAFGDLHQAGFDNVSLDLMYGLPDQSLEDWESSVNRAVKLAPVHLSLYSLTVEERTPFHRWIEIDGTMTVPDADSAADMYELASNLLATSGYRQYEISNWSLPGEESRHNVMYWKNEPFIGVGPGAHSFLGHARFSVESSPRDYIKRLDELDRCKSSAIDSVQRRRLTSIDEVRSIAPITGFDPHTRDMERRETLILGLRLNAGVSETEYRTRFGSTPTDLFRPELQEAIGSGLLERHGNDRLVLTTRGRLLANEVFVLLLESPDRDNR